MIKVLSFLSN